MEGEKLPTVSCAVEYQVKADKGLKRWLRLCERPNNKSYASPGRIQQTAAAERRRDNYPG